MGHRWQQLNTAQKMVIGVLAVIGAPSLVAGMMQGVKDSTGHTKTTAATPVATGSVRPAGQAAAPSTRPASTSTFTYPGDPQCAITYQATGGGMSWTARVTVAGELITHASSPGTDADPTGINRHDVQVTPGARTFTVPVPLARVTDVGGTLQTAAGQRYGCSVRPA
jgi:hypothetical protein